MESTMKCNMGEMLSSRMPSGLDLEVSHHPLTMKHVANLIIAMERMKGAHTELALGTEFRDEHLLSIMLDSLVEEQIVFECEASPDPDFTRTDQIQCSVTDSQKRGLVLVENSMELLAVTLQGGSNNHQVCLGMSTYVHLTPVAEARPVALSVKGTNYYLSCHMEGDKPTLNLETVADSSSLASISSDSEMVRFLFYKRVTGLNLSTFMSARFPNWYISTGEQDNEPLEMCQQTTGRHWTFNVQCQCDDHLDGNVDPEVHCECQCPRDS